MTDLPIKQVLDKPDVEGRMIKWAIELSEFDIRYKPQGPIIGQVLVDFIVELSPTTVSSSSESIEWILSVDEASNTRYWNYNNLEGLDDVLLKQSLWFSFKASNN